MTGQNVRTTPHRLPMLCISFKVERIDRMSNKAGLVGINTKSAGSAALIAAAWTGGQSRMTPNVAPKFRRRLIVQIEHGDVLAALLGGDGQSRGESGFSNPAFLGNKRENFHACISVGSYEYMVNERL